MDLHFIHRRASFVSERLIAVLFAIAVLLLFVILAVATKRRSWPEQTTPLEKDSRPISECSYRNVRPEVRYVGDEACAGCHADVAAAYRKHPMSHSLAPG